MVYKNPCVDITLKRYQSGYTADEYHVHVGHLDGTGAMRNADRPLAGRCAIGWSEVQRSSAVARETRMNAPVPVLVGLRTVTRHEGRAARRDFYHRYDLLLANWYLLTLRIQQEIEEVRNELHEELACWQPHQPEPDWNAYVDRMNGICRAEGFQQTLRRRRVS